jgi:hypothetical protein
MLTAHRLAVLLGGKHMLRLALLCVFTLLPGLVLAGGPTDIAAFRQRQRAAKDRKSTRLNSSHNPASRMPSSA